MEDIIGWFKEGVELEELVDLQVKARYVRTLLPYEHLGGLQEDFGICIETEDGLPFMDLTHLDTHVFIIEEPEFHFFVHLRPEDECTLKFSTAPELIDMLLEASFPRHCFKRLPKEIYDTFCQFATHAIVEDLS